MHINTNCLHFCSQLSLLVDGCVLHDMRLWSVIVLKRKPLHCTFKEPCHYFTTVGLLVCTHDFFHCLHSWYNIRQVWLYFPSCHFHLIGLENVLVETWILVSLIHNYHTIYHNCGSPSLSTGKDNTVKCYIKMDEASPFPPTVQKLSLNFLNAILMSFGAGVCIVTGTVKMQFFFVCVVLVINLTHI